MQHTPGVKTGVDGGLQLLHRGPQLGCGHLLLLLWRLLRCLVVGVGVGVRVRVRGAGRLGLWVRCQHPAQRRPQALVGLVGLLVDVHCRCVRSAGFRFEDSNSAVLKNRVAPDPPGFSRLHCSVPTNSTGWINHVSTANQGEGLKRRQVAALYPSKTISFPPNPQELEMREVGPVAGGGVVTPR